MKDRDFTKKIEKRIDRFEVNMTVKYKFEVYISDLKKKI